MQDGGGVIALAFGIALAVLAIAIPLVREYWHFWALRRENRAKGCRMFHL